MAYGGIAVVLFTLVAAVGRHPVRPELLPRGFGWLAGWIRLDAGWYHSIASGGYRYTPGQQSSVAFFPAYPLSMRLLGHLTPSLYVAGVLVTVAAGLVSAIVFWSWCASRLTPREAVAALGLLLVYPYSLYLYGAVYSDSLFLAAAVSAFLLLERGHPWWAGLIGTIAAAGRPVGVAVVIGLLVRTVELAMERTGAHDAGPGLIGAERAGRPWTGLGPLSWRDAGVLVSLLGLAGYCGYLWARFGDPFAFAAVQSAPGWQGSSGPRLWFKVALIESVLHDSPRRFAPVLVQALVWLVAVLLTLRMRSRFGWGYAAYVALIVAIPGIGTKDFMGCGRYLLAAFPLFAVAGRPPPSVLVAPGAARLVRCRAAGRDVPVRHRLPGGVSTPVSWW